jgi:large conductance mechanosensitive channel
MLNLSLICYGLITESSAFINRCINFLGIGVALYFLASTYQWLSHDPIIKHTVKCKYCRKRVSDKVSRITLARRNKVREGTLTSSQKSVRCIYCTSWLDGREDR